MRQTPFPWRRFWMGMDNRLFVTLMGLLTAAAGGCQKGPEVLLITEHPDATSIMPGPGLKIPAQEQKERLKPVHAEVERKVGNYAGSTLVRNCTLIHEPQVQAMLDDLVGRLIESAGRTGCTVRCHIVATPDINAYACPSGDIFICSGLLDTVENRDELAFVLAHELDHLFRHDTVTRLQQILDAKNTTTAIMIVAGAAAGAAGPLAGMAVAGGAAAAGAASTGTSLAMLGTQYTVAAMISTVGTLGATGVSSAMIDGYSQTCELRADSNAVQYARACGFRPQASLDLFRKLAAEKRDIIARGGAVASSLINCKPGLDRRIREMKERLAAMGVGVSPDGR